MSDWTRLPEDTTETCDVGLVRDEKLREVVGETFGWSTKPGAPDRCGKPASWIHRSSCGCGEKDMTIRECDDHYQKRTKEAAERKRKFDAEFTVVTTQLPGGIVKYSRQRKSQ